MLQKTVIYIIFFALTGGRQADDIVAWLKKKTGPVATQIVNSVEFKEITAANPVVVFGFFPEQGTDKAKTFYALAGLVDDQVFAVVNDEKLMEELEVTPESIVLIKNVSSF